MAVGAGLAKRTGGADACIVDEDIEPVGPLADSRSKVPHIDEAGEVGTDEFRAATRSLDLSYYLAATGVVAAMHQNSETG